MRLDQAQKLIDKYKERRGYRVHFQQRITPNNLQTDYFPNDLDEALIDTEQHAWELAQEFALSTTSDYVNIFVVDKQYQAVGTPEDIIRPYPKPEPKPDKSEQGTAGC